MSARVRAVSDPAPAPTYRDVREVYDAHADFVWITLGRLGVRAHDAEDVMQEVFVVVHKRLAEYDPSKARMTSWLYGICVNLVRADRRRAFRRRERAAQGNEFDRLPTEGAVPEASIAESQDQARLRALLDTLDLDKRAVLVMYEIDEMPCEEIAAILEVPVGTVHSRLHAARKELAKAAERMAKRDAREAREVIR